MTNFLYAWLTAGVIFACFVILGLNRYDPKFVEKQSVFALCWMVVAAILSGPIGLGGMLIVFIKDLIGHYNRHKDD
jgi:hypothetical protein